MKQQTLSVNSLYKAMNDQPILSGLSLRIYQEDITFVVGNPYSGKSLLAEILSGKSEPDRGTILLSGDNHPASTLRLQSAVYHVSANTPLFENLNAAENVFLTAPQFSIKLRYRQNTQRYVQSICNEFGIPLDASMPVKRANHLNRLLIHCARTAMRKSSILILDNVLYLLDPEELKVFFRTLESLRFHGITILIMEPVFKYVRQYSTRTLYIARGAIQMELFPDRYTDDILKHLSENKETSFVGSSALPRIRQDSCKLCFMTPHGVSYFLANRGAIMGVSCKSSETYYWYQNESFNLASIIQCNRTNRHCKIRVISYQDLHTHLFPDLSIAENISISTAGALSRHLHLPKKSYRSFLQSELSESLPESMLDWQKPIYKASLHDKELAVLYRTVIDDSDIIIFSGILDRPNPLLLNHVYSASLLAIERGKSVIIFGKQPESFSAWCSKTIFLDY